MAVLTVTDWLTANWDECAVDAVIMAEICRGIDRLPDGARKQSLSAWFMRLKSKIPCLAWTLDTAMEWALMANNVTRSGFTIGIKDTMIAASATHHGPIVVTRNVDDFTRCGVPVINPFS
ncbi:MAG: PIN domain-containing protein [Prosthecobacter sp.]